MKRVSSAGGVVYKFENDELKILLISTKDSKVWALPKGIIESGEDPKDTALREIKEETGIEGKIIDEIGETSYWFVLKGEKYFKTVKYFLVEYTNGQIVPQWEIDSAEWVSPEEAMKRITYSTDKEILKKALEKIHGQNFKS